MLCQWHSGVALLDISKVWQWCPHSTASTPMLVLVYTLLQQIELFCDYQILLQMTQVGASIAQVNYF